MWPSGRAVGQALGAAGLLLVLAGAAAVAARLGFAGLTILGVAAWLICTLARLDDGVPVASQGLFARRMAARRSPEEGQAERDETASLLLSLRFWGLCGAALAGIGAAGFVLQRLGLLPE